LYQLTSTPKRIQLTATARKSSFLNPGVLHHFSRANPLSRLVITLTLGFPNKLLLSPRRQLNYFHFGDVLIQIRRNYDAVCVQITIISGPGREIFASRKRIFNRIYLLSTYLCDAARDLSKYNDRVAVSS